jgi:hypothetical protein
MKTACQKYSFSGNKQTLREVVQIVTLDLTPFQKVLFLKFIVPHSRWRGAQRSCFKFTNSDGYSPDSICQTEIVRSSLAATSQWLNEVHRSLFTDVP